MGFRSKRDFNFPSPANLVKMSREAKIHLRFLKQGQMSLLSENLCWVHAQFATTWATRMHKFQHRDKWLTLLIKPQQAKSASMLILMRERADSSPSLSGHSFNTGFAPIGLNPQTWNYALKDPIWKIALRYEQNIWPKEWPRVMVQNSCSRECCEKQGWKNQLWEPPREREAAFSDLKFSSTWAMIISPLGVPVASSQVWISLVKAKMTRNCSGKCRKAPASQPLDPSFYWCVFCGTKNIPQSKRSLYIQYLLAISCHISSITHFGRQQGEEKFLSVRFQFTKVTEPAGSTLNSLPKDHNL